MKDRSSLPRHIPHRTAERMKRKIIALRWRHRLGPAQIAASLGVGSTAQVDYYDRSWRSVSRQVGDRLSSWITEP